MSVESSSSRSNAGPPSAVTLLQETPSPPPMRPGQTGYPTAPPQAWRAWWRAREHSRPPRRSMPSPRRRIRPPRVCAERRRGRGRAWRDGSPRLPLAGPGEPGGDSRPEITAVCDVPVVTEPGCHQGMPPPRHLSCRQSARRGRGTESEAWQRWDDHGEGIGGVPPMSARIAQQRQELEVFEKRAGPAGTATCSAAVARAGYRDQRRRALYQRRLIRLLEFPTLGQRLQTRCDGPSCRRCCRCRFGRDPGCEPPQRIG